MAGRKTRRSVSMRAEIYISVGRAADAAQQTMAAWVEEAVREKMERQGASVCSRRDALEVLGIASKPLTPRRWSTSPPTSDGD